MSINSLSGPSAQNGQQSPYLRTGEGSLAALLSNVFGGNDLTSQLVGLSLMMSASSLKSRDEMRVKKVEAQNHACDLGLAQAKEMSAAALDRFVSSMVAGSVGIVASVAGGATLHKLSKKLDVKPSNTPSGSVAGTAPQLPLPTSRVSDAGTSVAKGEGEPKGGKPTVPANDELQTKNAHNDVNYASNEIYKTQTQTQLVNLLFSQLITQVTDSIKAAGEFAASGNDEKAQVDKTVRDALLAHADEYSEHFGIEKECFENGVRAASEARYFSAFNN